MAVFIGSKNMADVVCVFVKKTDSLPSEQDHQGRVTGKQYFDSEVKTNMMF